MSAILWTDEAKDQGIDLGDPFRVLAVMAELARAAGSDEGWEELFSLPDYLEQQPDADWLSAVRAQAKRFLAEHGHEVSEHAKWVLGQLARTAPKLESRLGSEREGRSGR